MALACALACNIGGLAPQVAHAAGVEASKPSPRSAIEIGGASVVVVTANDHLYVFIDRIEDNVAVANADLRVAVAGGAPLQMDKAADGLFVTPFIRGRQMRDVFMVTLRSQAGSGDAPVQIAYDDQPNATGGEPGTAFGTKLTIALVAGGIGAIASASAMFRGDRRRLAMRVLGLLRTA
jgi:hypothetical protein